MGAIDAIEFVRDEISSHLRQYVEESDIERLLSRLPEETWKQLRRVRFRNGAATGGRLGDAEPGADPEISLFAQPYRVSFTPYLDRNETSETYGAVEGCRWPVLAIRRFTLYRVCLEQLGRIQVSGASEKAAKDFADHWRGELWSREPEDTDPAHRPPSEEECRLVRVGWSAAESEYETALKLDQAGERTSAFRHYDRAVEHYPDHALALEGLGKLTYAGFGEAPPDEKLPRAAKWLRRALEVDPGLPDASLYLAIVLSRMDKQAKNGAVDRTVVPDPCETISLATYAENLSKRGYREEAEDLFQKVLRKVPRKDSRRDRALRAYARMLLYRSKEPDEEDTRKAVDILKQAVRLNPTDATNHFYLGLAYSWLEGQETDAMGEVREALSLRPDYEAANELLSELEAKASE